MQSQRVDKRVKVGFNVGFVGAGSNEDVGAIVFALDNVFKNKVPFVIV